jgi:hypothetical protein
MDMTALYIILFLLATCVVALLAVPLTMLIAPDDWPDIWANIKFWGIVVACWVGVAWVAMYA